MVPWSIVWNQNIYYQVLFHFGKNNSSTTGQIELQWTWSPIEALLGCESRHTSVPPERNHNLVLKRNPRMGGCWQSSLWKNHNLVIVIDPKAKLTLRDLQTPPNLSPRLFCTLLRTLHKSNQSAALSFWWEEWSRTVSMTHRHWIRNNIQIKRLLITWLLNPHWVVW